jgi:Fe-S-cluster-containing dehydrogenase component
MRCTGCKSCTVACPFGIILPEFIPYLNSRCNYCLADGEIPHCVTTCPHKAIEFGEIQENPEENIYFIGEVLAIHSKRWSRAC